MTTDRALAIAVNVLTEGGPLPPGKLELEAAQTLENLRTVLSTGRPLSQQTRDRRVRNRYSTS